MAKEDNSLRNLPPAYDPGQVEQRVYAMWMAGDAFRAAVDADREPFCIVIPPPNVTGSLHIGHALNNTIQDSLIRRRRMQGYAALWLPGTDHAGIATQYVVERRLAEEGVSARDLGRDRFLERVWQWKDEYEAAIIGQLQRLGASCDWSRLRFTMDAGCSRAVREVFVHLYNRGLIYRGAYIINWCPRCRTTLADLEVEHREQDGRLYHLRYPLEGGGDIIVATTRPETMLGDTGIAVHPEDERYRDLVGRRALLPIIDRPLPIVADAWVDREFGTGAVKVTPGHDPDDFRLGERHGLPVIVAIDEQARMTAAAGPYQGMDRYQCREALVRDLQERGLLVKVEEHRHAVGHCYRCDTVVEPRVSEQWFVKMKPLAEPALAAVEQGRTRIVPERFARVYRQWLENIRDWPISRQIWWGHRIPAWYCPEGHITVAADDPAACTTCGSATLRQEEDVLDTWFSSALWPFSTLGWPEDTAELRYFYPTSVLVTGYDILFFWVARMMFMGLEFMDEVPFRTVVLHGLVRDAQGQKMSKSRGNTLDPLEVIDTYGADSLRWALTTGTAPGSDVRISPAKIQGARNFANKLWNAARFVLMHVDGFDPEGVTPRWNLADHWLLTRLQRTIAAVDRFFERYELAQVTEVLHEFIWSELCDWYIELAKPRLEAGGDDAETVRYTLVMVLEEALRLLHPIMPFITEEIWQRLPGTRGMLLRAPWPTMRQDLTFATEETRMEQVRGVVRAVRAIRADLNLDPARKVPLILQTDDREAYRTLVAGVDYIRHLAQAGDIALHPERRERPRQAAAAIVQRVDVFVPAAGLIDLDAETARLRKELQEVEAYARGLAARLADPRFTSRAPAEVVERERRRHSEALERLRRLRERIEQLSA